MPEYNVDGYALRMWSTRPTTNLSPGVAVAGIYFYEAKRTAGTSTSSRMERRWPTR